MPAWPCRSDSMGLWHWEGTYLLPVISHDKGLSRAEASEHTLAMTASAGARLTGGATGLIGREDELATLRLILADDGPRVLFVHGIGGVGKSALVEAFSASAREDGAVVIRLDGGAIEPTARGFTSALSAATGPGSDGDASTVAGLAHAGSPAIIVVDRYEVLRPLDVWLRQSFVPSMPADTRLLLAGGEPPVADWRLGLGDWFASLALGNLGRAAAFELLRRDGIEETRSRAHRAARARTSAVVAARRGISGLGCRWRSGGRADERDRR